MRLVGPVLHFRGQKEESLASRRRCVVLEAGDPAPPPLIVAETGAEASLIATRGDWAFWRYDLALELGPEPSSLPLQHRRGGLDAGLACADRPASHRLHRLQRHRGGGQGQGRAIRAKRSLAPACREARAVALPSPASGRRPALRGHGLGGHPGAERLAEARLAGRKRGSLHPRHGRERFRPTTASAIAGSGPNLASRPLSRASPRS